MNSSRYKLFITAVTAVLCHWQFCYVESTQPTQIEATNLPEESFPCPPWYMYRNGDSDHGDCQVRQCLEADRLPKELKCIDGKGAQVEFGYCITYDKNEHTFEFGSCHY